MKGRRRAYITSFHANLLGPRTSLSLWHETLQDAGKSSYQQRRKIHRRLKAKRRRRSCTRGILQGSGKDTWGQKKKRTRRKKYRVTYQENYRQKGPESRKTCMRSWAHTRKMERSKCLSQTVPPGAKKITPAHDGGDLGANQ